MFGFGKTIKDPLADAKTAERWLGLFPANDPLAMHGAVLAELGRLTERIAKRTPARLEAVFFVDRYTDPLRKDLTAQYLAHGTRSTRVESQLWQALFDLTPRPRPIGRGCCRWPNIPVRPSLRPSH